MPLQLATRINAIGRETEKGRNQGETCLVQLESGARSIAYVKALEPYKIAVEVICALLARHLGLPTPAPLLVHVPGESALRFGSAFIDAPPFRHAVRLDGGPAIARIRAWKHLVPTACFDEWIANPDRHAGNFLHDGKESFWLIDHEDAMLAKQAADCRCADNLMMKIATVGRDEADIATSLVPQVRGTLHSYRDTPLDPIKQRLNGQVLEACDTILDALAARQVHLPALGQLLLPQAQGDMFDVPAP